jgi:hypothetical protein
MQWKYTNGIYEKKVERLTFTFLSCLQVLRSLSLSLFLSLSHLLPLFVSPALLDCFLIDKGVVSLGRCPPGDARQRLARKREREREEINRKSHTTTFS